MPSLKHCARLVLFTGDAYESSMGSLQGEEGSSKYAHLFQKCVM